MATEYERKRLENIKRNDEMMAALNVHAKKASLLSAATKRPRHDDKKKKEKPETTQTTTTPIVIRKSQRTRGPQKPSAPLPLDAAGEEEEASSLNKLVETLSGIAASNKSTTRRSSRLSSNLVPLSSNVHNHMKKKMKVTSKIKKSVESTNDFDTGVMSLEPCNVVRVVPGRVLDLKFLPCENVRLLAAGDMHGNVGFWNLDCQGDGDGISVFRPHSSSVSSLVFQQNSFSKVISSSYDGLIRLMDVEKSVFDLVYSSDDAIYSLSQRANDEQSLYFGEGHGVLNIFDLRAGKSVFHWDLHGQRINTIDFNTQNPNVMATSSKDGTACLWDLRSMGTNKPKNLRTVNHSKAVHSAYFSPSGLSLATTSADNYLGIVSGPGLEDTSMIHHVNLSNRAVSAFRFVLL
ncbi:DROUGHT SENSITIVE 1 [Hirschfeldia incana]|nr:DROUGHT SENSITIVE 1 [Hirschfeldia incana]